MWPREFRLSITHCPVDARWFPFDEQRCDISFESKNSESKELDFSASSLQTTSPLVSSDSAEWTVLGIILLHCTETATLTNKLCLRPPQYASAPET